MASAGCFPNRPEAVGHLGIERDGITRLEFELLESNFEAERSADHVSVFLAAMADERVLVTRFRARLVHNGQEFDFGIGARCQPFPPNPAGEPNGLAVSGSLQGVHRVHVAGDLPVGGSVAKQVIDDEFQLIRDGYKVPTDGVTRPRSI